MNLVEEFTTKEIKLLESIGLQIENKIYDKNELKKIESYTMDYIMSNSSKTGAIGNLFNQYNNILAKIDNKTK